MTDIVAVRTFCLRSYVICPRVRVCVEYKNEYTFKFFSSTKAQVEILCFCTPCLHYQNLLTKSTSISYLYISLVLGGFLFLGQGVSSWCNG